MKRIAKLLTVLGTAALLAGGQPCLPRAEAMDVVPAATYTLAPLAGQAGELMSYRETAEGLVVAGPEAGLTQFFTLEPEGNGGFFSIRVAHTGLYLDASGSAAGQAQVTARAYTGQPSQLWYAVKQDNSNYIIFSALSTRDCQQMLRYVWGKVVLADEFEAGKNYVWRLENAAD